MLYNSHEFFRRNLTGVQQFGPLLKYALIAVGLKVLHEFPAFPGRCKNYHKFFIESNYVRQIPLPMISRIAASGAANRCKIGCRWRKVRPFPIRREMASFA